MGFEEFSVEGWLTWFFQTFRGHPNPDPPSFENCPFLAHTGTLPLPPLLSTTPHLKGSRALTIPHLDSHKLLMGFTLEV